MINRIQYISQQSDAVSHIDGIEGACAAGVKWIQLRVKEQPQNEVLLLAREAKAICDRHEARLIINDFPEVAAAIGAYGLHLGKEDMPVAKARALVGDRMIIGGTANTFEDIRQHYADGANYVGVGPYRFTTTKKKLSPVLGLDGYRNILQQCATFDIALPLIAIGGIELADIPGLLQAGVYGVAVSGLIAQATDRRQTVDSLYRLFPTQQTEAVC
ncbi:thiamine phosphate synthase [Paraflavisolibacter sp. H34]|uniref:thiamine phosphate synthase n=1 Tax=Huijunlia imazamoxiresistens TaxID=3127457 RepID=UPI003018D28A